MPSLHLELFPPRDRRAVASAMDIEVAAALERVQHDDAHLIPADLLCHRSLEAVDPSPGAVSETPQARTPRALTMVAVQVKFDIPRLLQSRWKNKGLGSDLPMTQEVVRSFVSREVSCRAHPAQLHACMHAPHLLEHRNFEQASSSLIVRAHSPLVTPLIGASRATAVPQPKQGRASSWRSGKFCCSHGPHLCCTVAHWR